MSAGATMLAAPAEEAEAPRAEPAPADRLAMQGVRHGIAWEKRIVMFLLDCARHRFAGKPDAVEALEYLRISVEAFG